MFAFKLEIQNSEFKKEYSKSWIRKLYSKARWTSNWLPKYFQCCIRVLQLTVLSSFITTESSPFHVILFVLSSLSTPAISLLPPVCMQKVSPGFRHLQDVGVFIHRSFLSSEQHFPPDNSASCMHLVSGTPTLCSVNRDHVGTLQVACVSFAHIGVIA